MLCIREGLLLRASLNLRAIALRGIVYNRLEN
jgi:hypothetical protein